VCDHEHVTAGRLTLALVLATLVAGAAAVGSGSSRPIPRIVFLVVSGHGKVTSVPTGISCPGTCRAFFPKDSRVRLVARPASGWKLGGWSGYFCSRTATKTCAFNLTTDHECSGSLCKVGAFGVRANFVTLSPPSVARAARVGS
jgi:hypothetical protein